MEHEFHDGEPIMVFLDGGAEDPVRGRVTRAHDGRLQVQVEGLGAFSALEDAVAVSAGEDPHYVHAKIIPIGRRRIAIEAEGPWRSVEARRAQRYPVWWPCGIREHGGTKWRSAVILDISTGGVAVEVPAWGDADGFTLAIEWQGERCLLECRVAGREESWAGTLVHSSFPDLGETKKQFVEGIIASWRKVFEEAQTYLISRGDRRGVRPDWAGKGPR